MLKFLCIGTTINLAHKFLFASLFAVFLSAGSKSAEAGPTCGSSFNTKQKNENFHATPIPIEKKHCDYLYDFATDRLKENGKDVISKVTKRSLKDFFAFNDKDLPTCSGSRIISWLDTKDFDFLVNLADTATFAYECSVDFRADYGFQPSGIRSSNPENQPQDQQTTTKKDFVQDWLDVVKSHEQSDQDADDKYKYVVSNASLVEKEQCKKIGSNTSFSGAVYALKFEDNKSAQSHLMELKKSNPTGFGRHWLYFGCYELEGDLLRKWKTCIKSGNSKK